MIATEVKDDIATLGGAWMLDATTRERGKVLGAGSWGFYMIGRGGVLGDVDPDVVRAAVAFFPEQTVRRGWEKARAVLTPAEGAREYADACQVWGRAKLAEAEKLDRLADLLERVVRAADPAGLPLFAGWRAMPLPDDPPARVAQLSHVLREHRGGLHAIAVLASGLTPLQGMLASGGPGNATFFGWPEPYEDVGHLTDLRVAAEELTDRLVEPAWSVLGDDAEETIELLHASRASITY